MSRLIRVACRKGGCPLGRGDRITSHVGPAVAASDVQEILSKLNYYDGKVDGFVGPRTEAAVKAFQYNQGLTADGWAGPRTMQTLQEIVQTNSDEVAVHQESFPQGSFGSIPGPEVEDMETYRTKNHWYINDLHNKHGDVVKVSRDGHPVVFFRASEDIRTVLLDEDNFAKTFDADDVSTSFLQYLMNIMQPLLREAKVFGSADNAKQRAIMRKTFMSAEEFLPGFAKAIDACLDRGELWGEGVVELTLASHMLVFEAVMVLIIGENTSYTREFYDESTRVLRFYEKKYSQPMYDMKLNDEDDEVMGRLKESGLEVVREFKRRLADGTQNRAGDSEEILERSMLCQLVREGSMSDDELCATMINTLLAASEGPAGGLVFTLAELSSNKAAQSNLYAEVANAQDKPRCFNTLPIVTGTVLEGLRLFSPVTLVQRYALKDTVVAGYTIPEGTVCAVCMAAVHRDENQFSDAATFDPTRSGLNYSILGKQTTFMPFSGGPRGCPGKHLAVCIMKQAFAKISERFEIKPAVQPDVVHNKVLKFVEWNVGGLNVELVKRRFSKL